MSIPFHKCGSGVFGEFMKSYEKGLTKVCVYCIIKVTQEGRKDDGLDVCIGKTPCRADGRTVAF